MLERLEQLYHGARAIADSADRLAYLHRECAGDDALRGEVESLLNADSQAESFLDTGDGPSSRPAGDGHLTERPGDMVGRYKLLQLVGEGGFGVVWMAEQRTPVVRRVALKILKPGIDTRAVIARFEAERQALAMMDHPSIARVFDAGATETGRPYFVMELVHGQPITGYCDHERLSIRRRLELFRQVCSAVQHAHSKGVIHRDLKPGNVIVTLSDGVPIPKVIDFGIAKAVAGAGELTEKTLFTHLGQFIGTPAYMSPEQASGSPDIDTRSDVYSLGVLLYELLAGVTPFDPAELRRLAYGEIQRVIREVDPPRPSTRLSTLQTVGDIAATRRMDPRRLGSLMRGELDWIVLRAMEKDRRRRYETPSELADDIDAFLSQRPVRACPPTLPYRLAKFYRRNRARVIVAGAIAIAGILGAIGTTVGFLRARAANIELESVVRFQQDQLEQINVAGVGRNLRQRLLEQADASIRRGGGDEESTRRLLDELDRSLAPVNFTSLSLGALQSGVFSPAIRAIDQRFDDRPILRARLLQSTATTMRTLGLIEAARTPQSTAVELRRAALGPTHTDTIESRLQLANLLNAAGDFAAAEKAYRELLELGDRHLGAARGIQATRLLGGVLKDTGRLDQADPLITSAADRAARELGPDHAETLACQNALAQLRSQQGRLEEAAELYLRAYDARQRTLGPDHHDTLMSLANVGVILHKVGRSDESEKYVRLSLERHRGVLGNEHIGTIHALHAMAGMLVSRGRFDEAEPFFDEALTTARRTIGDRQPETLMLANALGEMRFRQGRADEAEKLIRLAVEGRHALHGANHPLTIESVRNLGIVLLETGRAGEAISYLRQVRAARAAALGEGHPRHWMVHGDAVLLAEAMITHAEHQAGESVEPALATLSDVEALLIPAATWLNDPARPAGPGERPSLKSDAIQQTIRLYRLLDSLQPDTGHAQQAEHWANRLPPG